MLFNFGVYAQDPVLKPSEYSISSLAHCLMLIDLAWLKITLMMYARNIYQKLDFTIVLSYRKRVVAYI